jgi:phage baseplate assembly protein W
MARNLVDPPYLAFPFRVAAGAPVLADRAAHIRGRIEQVLFTLPGERVFRPDFGAGVKALVFEPNDTPLWQITKRRLLASLAQALQGDVEPRSIEVEITSLTEALKDRAAQGGSPFRVTGVDSDAVLVITITYVLAAIGQHEKQVFSLGSS